ncbi:MAG: bifunctional folylpolyglutamate synthase/dihydrofolate synthase [Sphingobacteriaceae bacterium]
MDYKQTLDYLYSRLPMFSKLGASAIKKDLFNTVELCKRLNNPQNQFTTIHVAGTNGKGSVSHMIAAILQTAGYKTGLYTSPHLRDFRERIRINGEMISEADVIQFVKQQQKNIEEIEPSFFEVTVAMAFQYFASEKIDIAVIEVGLGGRLDSTNIITPLLSVITNIGYDHTNILGNTLPEIAYEKAGIIKPDVPVVIGERHQETDQVFINKAGETGSELVFASDEWIIESNDIKHDSLLSLKATQRFHDNNLDVDLDLTGTYQLKNLKTVLSAVTQLRLQGFNITNEQIKNALKQVKTLTGLMGRWETLNYEPLIICDTGHNEHGIKEVIKNIQKTPYNKLHMVIGMVKDKDITKVLSLLPSKAEYYFCQPDIERAKPAKELAQAAQLFNLNGTVYSSVKEAVEAAKTKAEKHDLIFVGGSTFVVAEII